MSDGNGAKPWYQMGLGLKARAAPVYMALRFLPTPIGEDAYVNWINKTRQKRERETYEAFDRVAATLDRDSVVLDVGANVGDFTERLARTGAQVHSFEPEPMLFSALERRFAGASNVTLHNAAVAAKSGTVELFIEPDHGRDPLSLMSHSIIAGGSLTTGAAARKVVCLDFFEFVAALGRKPALVKMDIEGAEVEILERMIAKERFGDFGMMFVETHERQIPGLRPRIVRIFRHVLSRNSPNVNLFWP